MALTDRQKRFVDEYLIDLNASAAYKRAGYSAKGNSAEVNAARLLRNAQIKAQIAQAIEAREKRTHITQDRVLQELARIAFFDLRKLYREDGSLKPVHELDDDAAAVLAGVDVVEMAGGASADGDEGVKHIPMYTKKAKIPDKVGALGLAMRHLGMLKDKTEHTGKDGSPLLPPVINLVRAP